MNGLSFPALAMILGVAVAATLPLLTQLIVTEFGFFITAVGAGIGVNRLQTQGMERRLLFIVICCASMAGAFLYSGMNLWPGYLPG